MLTLKKDNLFIGPGDEVYINTIREVGIGLVSVNLSYSNAV